MEKLVIYKKLGTLFVTTESNYNAHIKNARLIYEMHDFSTPDEVIDYYINYFGSNKNDFIVLV